MIVLILIFILLFAFSCAALAVTDKYEHTLLSNGWNNLDNETKGKWEKFGNCCGFDNKTRSVARPCHGQAKSEVRSVAMSSQGSRKILGKQLILSHTSSVHSLFITVLESVFGFPDCQGIFKI